MVKNTFEDIRSIKAANAILAKGGGKDPWGGYHAGFSGTTTIDVTDYDFKAAWAGQIQLELLIEGTRK